MTAVHSVPTTVPAPGPTSGSSQPVALRVVPSRRYPGPLPAVRAEPGDPVTGRLLVDTTHSVLSPHLRTREVAVRVDGRTHRCAWGRTMIDLPAGRHLVEIEVEHAAGWGRVTEEVPVAAGSWVPVYYRAPVLPGVRGVVGPSPQVGSGRRGAVLALAVLTTVLAAVLVVVGLVAAVAGAA